jgi:polyferredoxin
MIIFLMALSAGGYKSVDFFYLTDYGISVSGPMNYFIYYTVLLVFFGLAVFVGRRAGCHSICWMSPFMIIGRKIRNFFKWPALRLTAQNENCINCKKCTQNCPMSLDVNGMVQVTKMEHTECILCGSCVDVCPQDVIHYSFSGGTEG